MLMFATLLAPQCVNCVWRNAPECNNTSFSALIKFFDVSKRRRPISSAGTNTLSFRLPRRRFLFIIYLSHVNSHSAPPSPSPATDAKAKHLPSCLQLCGRHKVHFSGFLSRCTNHEAALGARWFTRGEHEAQRRTRQDFKI